MIFVREEAFQKFWTKWPLLTTTDHWSEMLVYLIIKLLSMVLLTKFSWNRLKNLKQVAFSTFWTKWPLLTTSDHRSKMCVCPIDTDHRWCICMNVKINAPYLLEKKHFIGFHWFWTKWPLLTTSDHWSNIWVYPIGTDHRRCMCMNIKIVTCYL